MAGNLNVLFVAVLLLAMRCEALMTRLNHLHASVAITSSRIWNPGSTVSFQCDFTLSDEKEPVIVVWFVSAGPKMMLSYNHTTGESVKFDDYQRKIISSEYLENVGGELDRRHVMRMRVDNCDRTTYVCCVFTPKGEGGGYQALPIQENLPYPQMCLELDGRCHSGSVFRENTTTVVVRCTVSQASSAPYITVTRNGEDIPVTPTAELLDGCVYNTVAVTSEQVVEAAEKTTFRCEVNYGGTRRSTLTSIGSCGRSAIKPHPEQYIAGGQDAEPNLWPWQVSLRGVNGGHICGGSLVSNNFVITAAHCVPRVTTDIYLGAHDRTNCTAACRTVMVTEVWTHPNYEVLRQGVSNNDLAIVKFYPPVEFTNTTSPVCLPDSSDELPAGTFGYVTGWGNLWRHGPPAKYLQELPVELWPQQNCSRSLPRNFRNDSMICARNRKPVGRGTCPGDSGGPLVCKMPGENQWKLFGITSWGRGCGRPHPASFVRVVNYVQWINDILQGISGERQEKLWRDPAWVRELCKHLGSWR